MVKVTELENDHKGIRVNEADCCVGDWGNNVQNTNYGHYLLIFLKCTGILNVKMGVLELEDRKDCLAFYLSIAVLQLTFWIWLFSLLKCDIFLLASYEL
jgi:hypothetical protein